MSDDESCLSEDESEVLVYVECEGYVDGSVFKNEKLQLDIIGVDSDHPIMQINGKFYEGTYHDAVGTYMFFEKDEAPVVDDPAFETPATLKYFAKTRKLLKMERVFTMQRTEVLGDSDHLYCLPNISTIKEAGVPSKYQDDALQFWEKMREDRMEALKIYLEKQQIRDEKRLKGIELDSESDDDNPFAIYKSKTIEGTNNAPSQSKSQNTTLNIAAHISESEDIDISNILNKVMKLDSSVDTAEESWKIKPGEKLTVIDPGPSTSKHTHLDMPLLASMKKKKSSTKAMSKSKSKVVFKKPNKRAPKSKKSQTMIHSSDETSKVSSLVVESDSDEIRVTGKLEVSHKKDNSDENTSGAADESSMSRKLVNSMSKRLEKQAKREAKMKEISRRLKAHKDEFLKSQHHVNAPQDSGNNTY
ncbi:uncharacterized protein LOC124407666 [Diprion similis]|uniref:uncharacterized protein LOC124407666 n=1 Tax=Diprion similis TaxID=362088 RepID=UPI001EF85CB0|nr:uncharacterized protein LOC124407666 [Diprion similis]